MHSKKKLAVKKQKSPVSGHFSQTMLEQIADRIDFLGNAPIPLTQADARKQLINLYKTLFEVSSYYHQVIMTPSKDAVLYASEQGVIEGALDGMEAMTEQALLILNHLKPKGDIYNDN